MALQVNCSMCNGHFEADALAIRRELMVCPFCMTANRITAVGTEMYEVEIRERPLPPEIQRYKFAHRHN